MSEGCQSNQCVWSDHPEQVTTLWIECQTTIVCDTLECQTPWSMSAVGQATCWTSKQWSSVMYIIKSRITLHQTDGWHRIWKSRGECYVAVNMAPNHGAGGVGVTDWAVTPMDGKKLMWSFTVEQSWASHTCKASFSPPSSSPSGASTLHT